jgi:hypothetical protein
MVWRAVVKAQPGGASRLEVRKPTQPQARTAPATTGVLCLRMTAMMMMRESRAAIGKDSVQIQSR